MDYYEICTKEQHHKMPAAKMPPAFAHLKCSQVELLLGVQERLHYFLCVLTQFSVWENCVLKKSWDMVVFTFSRQEGLYHVKPTFKNTPNIKGSLFIHEETQPYCCISPFDPDHNRCHRMKVVDHQIPSHRGTDGCPHPDKLDNPMEDCWMTKPKNDECNHQWKSRRRLTQPLDQTSHHT